MARFTDTSINIFTTYSAKTLQAIKRFFSPFKHVSNARFVAAGVLMVTLGLGLNFWLNSDLKQHDHPSANHVASDSTANLITGQDWLHFAGADVQPDGVHIMGLGRAIVNQDGSGGQPNPPVNVRGPHLEVKGNFRINYSVGALTTDQTASLYFYGQVPIIYDEWRHEGPALRLDVRPGSVSAYIWDGSSSNYVFQKEWVVMPTTSSNLYFKYTKTSIEIGFGNKKLGYIANYNIFSDGKVWFGADGTVGQPPWVLNELSVTGLVKDIKGSNIRSSEDAQVSLRSLASDNPRHLAIGAAVANYALFSDAAYRQLVAAQFNLVTPENELKPQFIHPQANIYSFAEVDSIVEFAVSNGMQIHGHTLEFSEANPRWMQESPISQRQTILTSHIDTVVKHFGDKINEWDVVNEPLADDDSGLRSNIWLTAMGESYIDKAFSAAHAANPNAKLYINEYGLEQDGERWDLFLALINRLQARGVPINGVGFQAHIHEPGDELDTQVLKNHIQILSSMGLSSRISEIDVYGDEPQNQANQYAAGLQACLSELTCTSYTTWGVTDRYGSTTDTNNYPLSLGNDLIWDTNLEPKTAYNAMLNILKN